jgi:hypothetical protein
MKCGRANQKNNRAGCQTDQHFRNFQILCEERFERSGNSFRIKIVKLMLFCQIANEPQTTGTRIPTAKPLRPENKCMMRRAYHRARRLSPPQCSTVERGQCLSVGHRRRVIRVHHLQVAADKLRILDGLLFPSLPALEETVLPGSLLVSEYRKHLNSKPEFRCLAHSS